MKLLIALCFLFALSSARITISLEKVQINRTNPESELGSNAVSVTNTFFSKNSDEMKINWMNMRNSFYFGNIFVGSNNQTMKALFDTGSNELWLSTPSCYGCPGKNKFSCSESRTCKKTTKEGAMAYGLGKVSGYYASDMIGLTPTYRVEAPFLLVNYGTDLKNYKLVDGFIGLGNKNSAQDFIDLAFDAGQIDSKIFSIYMDKNLIPEDGYFTNGTTMTIGYVPEEKINNIAWVPVTNSDRWATSILGIKVGDTVLSSVETSGDVLFDTGCSYNYLTSGVVNELLKQMRKFDHQRLIVETFVAAECWPCEDSDFANYPNISLSLSGLRINLNPASYMDIGHRVTYNNKAYCPIAMAVSTFGVSILGDAWLKENFMVYSKLNQTLGIDMTAGYQILPNPNPPIFIIIIQAVLMIAIGVFMIMNLKKKNLQNKINKSSMASQETFGTQPMNSNQAF